MDGRQTFRERLSARYPGRYEIVKAGFPDAEHILFPAENPRFGPVKIRGNLDEWRDEEDYYQEDENGVYDDAETCGLELITNAGHCFLSPTGVFERLDKIFADELVLYQAFRFSSVKSGFYERAEFERMLKEGRLRKGRGFKLCLWSGNFPYAV